MKRPRDLLGKDVVKALAEYEDTVELQIGGAIATEPVLKATSPGKNKEIRFSDHARPKLEILSNHNLVISQDFVIEAVQSPYSQSKGLKNIPNCPLKDLDIGLKKGCKIAGIQPKIRVTKIQ